MEPKSDQAIVLRSQKYAESGKRVTLFLKEEGKRIGVAKGALVSKRRFGSALEIGSVIQVVFQESPRSEWIFLKEASHLEKGYPWRSSWKGMVVGSYCLELAGRLLPEQKEAKDKFELLQNLLLRMEENTAVKHLLLFERHWIHLSGMAPRVEENLQKQSRLDPAACQKILDAYWESLLGKPLLSAKLLEKIFVV